MFTRRWQRWYSTKLTPDTQQLHQCIDCYIAELPAIPAHELPVTSSIIENALAFYPHEPSRGRQ